MCKANTDDIRKVKMKLLHVFFDVVWPLIFAIVLVADESRKFDPYADDGGTIVGIAGDDYCLIAADCRLSAVDQYFIRSRNVSRLSALEDGIVLAGSGCWSDFVALSKFMQLKALQYKWSSKQCISAGSMSSLLSNTLYQRRFMPYYTFCTLAGLDGKGRGVLYRYDAVGSSERVTAACSGKGEQMIQPMLDEITHMEEDEALWQVGEGGSAFVSTSQETRSHPLTLQSACELVLRAFRAAAEREVTVGDAVEICVLQREHSPVSTLPRAVTIRRTYHKLPQH